MDKKKFPYEALGNELSRLRGKYGKKAFAIMIGVKPQSYSRYESGERQVPAIALKKAEELGAKLSPKNVLKEPQGLFGRSSEKVIDGKRMMVVEYAPEEKTQPEARQTHDQGDLAHAITLLARLTEHLAKAMEVEARLERIEKIIRQHHYGPKEKRSMMKQLNTLMDDDSSLE